MAFLLMSPSVEYRHSAARAKLASPEIHEHRPAKYEDRSMFVDSGPDPSGHPRMSLIRVQQHLYALISFSS
jgi:hypothetical protein